ncbi:hypothetical protein V8G54_018761, partial [Vigna mungo]
LVVAITTIFFPVNHRRRRRHLPLQIPHHLPHAGPLLWCLRGTQQPHFNHHQNFHLIKRATQPGVHHRQRRPHAPPVPDPVHQHQLLRQCLHLNGPPSAHHLQQQRSESVNIRTGGGFPRSCEFRCKVSHRSHHTCGARVGTMLVKLGQPKIPQPPIHVTIQQNVPRFDVSVNHRLFPLLMQIHQSQTHSLYYLKPFLPR